MLEGLIGAFGLSVGLGVERRGEGGFNAEGLVESSQELGVELATLVRDGARRGSVELPDVFEEEVCCLFGVDLGGGWDEVTSFGVATDYNKDVVIAVGGWEFGDEVVVDVGPGSFRDR